MRVIPALMRNTFFTQPSSYPRCPNKNHPFHCFQIILMTHASKCQVDDETSSWILIDLIMSSHGTQLNVLKNEALEGIRLESLTSDPRPRQWESNSLTPTNKHWWLILTSIFWKISGKHTRNNQIKGPTAKAKWKTLPSWTTRNCPITLPKTHLHLFAPFFLFNSPCTLHPQIATDESSRFQPLYFFEGM